MRVFRHQAIASTRFTSALALLCLVGACTVGCGGGAGSEEPGPTEDTGTTAEVGDETATIDTGAGDDTGGGDTGVGDDTGGGADTGGGSDADDGATDGGGGDGGTDAGDDGATDSGAADTGSADTGAADTGPADTGPIDTGTDTGPDPCGATACSVDSDGDGIPDSVEGRCAATPIDSDGDGTPDYLDTDSDNDGIPDKVEWAGGGCDATTPLNDADGDGVPNFRDTDSDGNGLLDKDEACPPVGMPGRPAGCSLATPADFDGDGVPDFLDPDNDHDSSSTDKTVGLDDKFELTNAAGTYVGLVDTDGDGVPDLWDRDADGDGIFDLEDGLGDPDKDGKRNFQDIDSDGDGVGDKCEGTVDTDGDGKADYLDIDSDGDLLLDKDEDKDFDCVVDTNETSRIKKDTDGDGIDDLIETTLIGVAGAKDPALTPAKAGKFYFVEPYSFDGSAAPSPTSSLLALSTALNKGDVAFIVDTTGSMGGTITGLRGSLSTTIIPALKAKIPDLGIGVAAHDDVPYSTYGSAASGDLPFYLAGGASGYVTTVTATSQAAANALTTHYGGDGPESNVLAMYKALTGVALTWPTGSLAADSPPATTFGAMRFRSDALPIVMNLTDITSHNGKRALDKTATSYSGFENTYSFSTYNVDDLVTKFNELGAKFLGGAADGGARSTAASAPYGFLSYVADKTSSYAPPSAFPTGTCQTGVSGAAVAADGPMVGGVRQCRLVFSFNSSGTGLATSVVDGVVAILNSIKFDVYVRAIDDTSDAVDAVNAFMTKVEPQPAGGTDPVTGSVCEVFSATLLADKYNTPKAAAGAGDIKETITALNPGKYYCYSVVPKANTTVAATSVVQTFKASLRVLADKPTGGTFVLGTDREVLFIVPPLVN